jgi:hypothetical protein
MTDSLVRGESRRSTRVALKIVISVQGLGKPLNCDGETITVNRHGALISSSVPLRIEMKIKIEVVVTSKSAQAKVVYVDPERPRLCGIALEEPENIWGVSVPPDDWYETHET